MSAIHSALLDLAEEVSWFVRARESRILCIEVDDVTRGLALAQVASAEGHADNRSPFFALEDAHTAMDPGWLARAERVSAIHAARRTAMAETGYRLETLPPSEDATSTPEVAFAARVEQCLVAQAKVPELDGLMLVFGPTVIEAPARFTETLAALLGVERLASVRAMLVEFGSETATLLTKRLGDDAVVRSRCVVDKETLRKEQAATLTAAAGALPAASPQAHVGFAGPRDVAAPVRHGEPPRDAPLSPELEAKLAKELDSASALLGTSGALLRRRVLSAAAALQAGRFADAVRIQTEACTQCLDAGLMQVACVLETTLGTFLLHAGERAAARRAFETSAARAEAHGLFDTAAQALLGLAAVLALDRNAHEGALTYARAGELAEKASAPMLAIEAYRCAGQVALRAGAERGAIDVWQRALRVTSQAPAEVAGASSAPIVARQFAKLAQASGAIASAQSLLEQADEYERRISKHNTEAQTEGIAHAGE